MATGIDTNVLLRWTADIDDEEEFRRRAVAAIEARGGTIHVGIVALVEFVWVLERTYRMRRADVVSVLRRLLENPLVRLESSAAVAEAVGAYETGGAGFADRLLGITNADAGCDTTLTFDKAASRDGNFTLIP